MRFQKLDSEEPSDENKPFYHSPINRLMRYQTTINRQLYQAINQLERLQRLRKGDHVPAPLNLQVLGDASTISEEENPRTISAIRKITKRSQEVFCFPTTE